jgi:general secretion pathway protein B
MSFILDALKKAESERSRNAGPVLMDVRIAPPRQRLPAWAWILGGVLVANLLGLAWMLLRKPATAPAAVPAVAAVTQPLVPPPAAPVAASPQQAPAVEPAPVPPVVSPPSSPAPALPPTPPVASPPEPSTAAIPPPPVAPAPAYPPSPRIDNLPTAQDLVAQGVSLPNLQMNLHVYDAVPANRYVLLNARRLREGDEVADGIRVESITPGGVVLNLRGRRFVVLAGG